VKAAEKRDKNAFCTMSKVFACLFQFNFLSRRKQRRTSIDPTIHHFPHATGPEHGWVGYGNFLTCRVRFRLWEDK